MIRADAFLSGGRGTHHLNLRPPAPQVFVIGDLALAEHNGKPLPMIAPVAIQQGTAAARNVLRLMTGDQTLPFHYQDRGAMVTIGRNAAVVCLGQWTFTGFFAWIQWLIVHFINLIGFRTRLLVLASWAWDYLFFERAVRLILPAEKERPLGGAQSAPGLEKWRRRTPKGAMTHLRDALFFFS